jgi:hypothetical protein
VSATSNLDERYGRRSDAPTRRRRRLMVVGLTGLAVIAVIAWVISSDVLGFGPQASARDVGHSLLGPGSVRVDFEVTATPGREVACAVEAQDETHGIVGWKVFVYPPSSDQVRAMSEVVTTVRPATTGLVARCWLT